ncbi:hypothetical protein TI06_23505, partial [Vibrio vulnificus]
RAGGRVLRSARAERLGLFRHGLLPGGAGAEHPLARGPGAQARRRAGEAAQGFAGLRAFGARANSRIAVVRPTRLSAFHR